MIAEKILLGFVPKSKIMDLLLMFLSKSKKYITVENHLN